MDRYETEVGDRGIGLEGPMVTEHMPGGRTYRLARNFSVVLRDGSTITVPRSFVTDFASVPRFFWRLYPPHGPYSIAALVHDFLYRVGMPGVSRVRADRIFLELMERGGSPRRQRYPMYWAVRAFGAPAWKGER